MSQTEPNLDEYLRRVPRPEEIRERLSANLKERTLLRRLLKVSEDARKVEEVNHHNPRPPRHQAARLPP